MRALKGVHGACWRQRSFSSPAPGRNQSVEAGAHKAATGAKRGADTLEPVATGLRAFLRCLARPGRV